jgi:hypothetical protein
MSGRAPPGATIPPCVACSRAGCSAPSRSSSWPTWSRAFTSRASSPRWWRRSSSGSSTPTLGFFLKVVTAPLSLITFGFFLLVVNALMLMLASSLLRGFEVRGFGAALAGAVVLALVQMGLRWLRRRAASDR